MAERKERQEDMDLWQPGCSQDARSPEEQTKAIRELEDALGETLLEGASLADLL